MKQSLLQRITLILAGIIAIIVGAGMLFFPVAFHATSGITLDNSVNLMNEMRASGGALFAGGILVFAGAFIHRLAFASILIAVLLYLSYGTSRIISMIMDGMPDSAMLQITAFEIVVGLLCAFVLFKYSENTTHASL